MSAISRSSLRRLGWLALLAMLSLALLPTLGRAMAHGPGVATSAAEICTPQGLRTVALADDAAQDRAATPAEAHLAPCALCLLSAQLLLPVPPLLVLPAPLRAERPRTGLPPPRPPHAWGVAQPRGPPAQA